MTKNEYVQDWMKEGWSKEEAERAWERIVIKEVCLNCQQTISTRDKNDHFCRPVRTNREKSTILNRDGFIFSLIGEKP